MRFNKHFDLPALRAVLLVISVSLVIFVSLPTLYLVIWSVKGTSNVGTFGSFTTQWYSLILSSKQWRWAFLYSIIVALVSSSISVISALLYFYYSMWFRNIYQSVGYLLLIGPLLFPTIIYGLALRTILNANGFPELSSLIIGHTMLMFPVQYFLLESSNESVRIEWIFSAATMGAGHREIIWRILRPVLRGPILVSFAIGFLISFDEIVIATFVIDSASVTIPKRMWDAINYNMDPSPAVVGTLILLFSLSSIILYRRLVHKNARGE